MNRWQPKLALVGLNLKRELAFGLVDWLQEQGLRVIVPTFGSGKPLNALLQKPYDALELTMCEVVQAPLHTIDAQA